MKKKKVLFLVICILLVGTYLGYRYLYKDHRDIQAEIPSQELSAENLLSSFQSQPESDLLNKTLIVYGTVSEIDTQSITLNESVHCVLLESVQGISEGDEIIIKGRCIGYDDLFEIVKLDQCQLIETP